MSKLDELIAELCPDGVVYKRLGEIGYFYGGLSGKSKHDFANGNAKFITYMNVYSNLAVDTEISDMVKIGENEKQNTVKHGDILFTGSSETLDECGISSVLTKETNEKLYLNSFCFGFRLIDKDLLLPDFSKYLFRSNEIRKQIIRTASGVTRFNVSREKMEQVIIPLPPLPVQQEIVRILDNFTELTTQLKAELTAELTARRKQYEYYRNYLSDFKDDSVAKSVTLGEIASYSKNRINALELNEETYVGVDNLLPDKKGKTYSNYVPTEGRLTKFETGDILIGNIRPYLKKIWLATNVGGTNGDVLVISLNDKKAILPEYLYFVLSSDDFFAYAVRHSKGGKMPRGDKNAIMKYSVPIPPIEEQKRIVAILDRFDALCNDLTSGIPAEIEARQKQYEYYRDKLLTFPARSKDVKESKEATA